MPLCHDSFGHNSETCAGLDSSSHRKSELLKRVKDAVRRYQWDSYNDEREAEEIAEEIIAIVKDYQP